jgi:hypothetical protein
MRIPQLLIALSPWSSYSTPGTSHLSSDSPELSPLTVTPIPCLSAPLPPTIEDLVTCFEGYTVPKDHYTSTTYNNAQPTTPQLAAWNLAVHNLLDVDNNCASVAVPTAINTFYRRSLFTEAGGRAFCILSEIDATGGHYTKGWGFMAVPVNRRAVSRFIHISAPHPIYDDGTPRQAAAIFQKTGAKSLLISGRHRNAYTASSCIGADYSRTDPAHNTVRLHLSVLTLGLALTRREGRAVFRCEHNSTHLANYTRRLRVGTMRLHSIPWERLLDLLLRYHFYIRRPE